VAWAPTVTEPSRPALRIWPGYGSWHLKRAGARTQVRYSALTRDGRYLVATMMVEDRALRDSVIPLDKQVRAVIASQLRQARQKK